MARHLLFDSGCTTCSRIAEDIDRTAGGWLTVRSLHDEEMRGLLARHRPGRPARPALVVTGPRGVRVHTGLGMSVRIAAGLGVRRATAVARLVAAATGRAGADPGRRRFLQGTGAGLVALAGLAVGAVPAHAAPDDGRPLTEAELAEVLVAVRSDAGYQAEVTRIGGLGYATSTTDVVGFRGTDGTTLVLSFFAFPAAVETRAAAIAHEIAPDGSSRTVAELVERDEAAVTAAAPSVDDLSVQRVDSDGLQLMSPAAYFSCMLGCVGVTCAGPASNCIRIPNLPAALVCVAGFCGFRAYRCHRTCRRAW